MISERAGCDFHERTRGDCIHCLAGELAMARAEIVRLTEWIRHLVEGDELKKTAGRK